MPTMEVLKFLLISTFTNYGKKEINQNRDNKFTTFINPFGPAEPHYGQNIRSYSIFGGSHVRGRTWHDTGPIMTEQY